MQQLRAVVNHKRKMPTEKNLLRSRDNESLRTIRDPNYSDTKIFGFIFAFDLKRI